MLASHRFGTLILAVLVIAGVSAVQAAENEQLWIHVKVHEGDGAKVMVNLPLSLVEKAVELVPAEHMHHAKIDFDGADMDAEDLRQIWQEIQDGPDMTYVTVEEADESVRVWKENDFLHVRVRESDEEGEEVDVRMPLQVVSAMLSGDEGELDIAAGLRALAAHGDGELVTVNGRDETVRVWIDGIAEAGK